MKAGAALITGAAQRLGRAMALDLAAADWDIAIHYSSSGQAAEALAREIAAMGRRSVTLGADLLDEDACQVLVGRARAGLGRDLTLLINNASIFEYDTIRTATRASWDRHLGSNLRAPFVLTQEFARQAPPALTGTDGEKQAQAAIINMTDQRVLKPTPEFMTYSLAKMALWDLTRTSAQALAPEIRVNAIGPGPTLKGARQSAKHFATQRKATILQRGADPQDIVAAMRFILDSPGLTGQLLCIDGGQHLAWQTRDIVGLE